jgi:uncharacterized protein YjeT (DUF2065 family)
MAQFLYVLGLTLIIEGIPYFAFPDSMTSLLAKLPLIPSRTLRLFDITAISAGLLLIYIISLKTICADKRS